MNFKAEYIDVVHYRISDQAAHALCRASGRTTPKIGREQCVRVFGNACGWLNRTPYSIRPRAPKRGWVWCVHSISDDTTGELLKLGKSFTFTTHP